MSAQKRSHPELATTHESVVGEAPFSMVRGIAKDPMLSKPRGGLAIVLCGDGARALERLTSRSESESFLRNRSPLRNQA